MIQKVPNQFSYYLFSLLVLLLVSFFIVRALTPFGVATSPDSIKYLDIAYNFQRTSQIGQTDLSIENNEKYRVVPQRIWPPGYPVLLSYIISDPFDVVNISNLSIFLLFTTSFLILILLRAGQINWLSSLIFSTLSMVTLPLVLIYGYAWSETLFIPILLGVIVSFWGYLKNQKAPVWNRFSYVIVISILATCLSMTRYIGIFIFFLFPIAFILGEKTLSNFILIVFGSLINILCVGGWLWGNYKQTGTLSGGYRAFSELTVFENIFHTFESFRTIFPTSWLGFFIAGIASTVFLYIFIKLGYSWSDKMPTTSRAKFVTVLLSVTFLYLFALISMRSYSHFDQIDVRLIAPAIPPFLVVFAIVPAFFSNKKNLFNVSVFLSLFIFFSLVTRGYDCLNSAVINWDKIGTPLLPMRGKLSFNNFTPPESGTSSIKAFNSIISPGGKLVIDRPLTWRFITRLETAQKPSQLNDAKIELLNKLPEGSAILLSKKEALLVEKTSRVHGWTIDRLNIGRNVVIRLPLNSEWKKPNSPP